MATGGMHSLPVKLPPAIRWMLPACWHWPMISLAIVEMMIDVSIETIRPVVPGACTDEYAACEPFGPVITIRCAVVRRNFIVSVWTNGRRPDADGNLRLCVT